jgi:hypothetical protein
MSEAWQEAIDVAGTGRLVWGAVADTRWRKTPVLAGIGLLGLGLVVLLVEGRCLWAANYLVAVWRTRGGTWRYVLAVTSLALLVIEGWEVLPSVAGVLLVAALFWRR